MTKLKSKKVSSTGNPLYAAVLTNIMTNRDSSSATAHKFHNSSKKVTGSGKCGCSGGSTKTTKKNKSTAKDFFIELKTNML